MKPQQEQDWKMTNAHFVGLAYLLLNSHRVCLSVFIRRSFGTRAFDPFCLTGFLILLVMMAAYRWMQFYLLAWFVMLVWRRLESFRVKGVHSQYPGYPWLGMRWPGVKTEWGGRVAEPFLCLLLGAVLFTVYPPLGVFVAAGFVSFGGVLLIDRYIDWLRMRAMKDAEAEMRYMTERWRER